MGILAIVIASLFVPETSDRQVSTSPMNHGEVAFVDIDGMNAKLLIGSNTDRPLYVVDESSLRGYEYEYLGRDEFVVTTLSNLTRTASKDLWYNNMLTAGTVASLRFDIPSGVFVDDIEITLKSEPLSPIAPVGLITEGTVKDGNTVTYTLSYQSGEYGALKIELSEPKVRLVKCGDTSYVNDLSTKKIISKDRLGKFDLYDLRYWTKHLYDGNRGEDWSAYEAYDNVRMAGRRINFGTQKDGNHLVSMGENPGRANEFDLSVRGYNALTFTLSDGNFVTNGTSISFSAITMNQNGSVDFGINTSGVSGFNVMKMHLMYSETIDEKKSWIEIPFSVKVASPLVVTASKNDSKSGFYVLKYGSREPLVESRGVTRTKRLQLMGVDNVLYEITVNAGVISATAVQ